MLRDCYARRLVRTRYLVKLALWHITSICQRHSGSMMCFMYLCCVLALQMAQYSHLHAFSVRVRSNLRLTGFLITDIASCAEQAASVNSLYVGLAMGLSTTHRNQKRTCNVARKHLVITGSLSNNNSLLMKRYHGETVSNARTSLARH